MYDQGHVSVVGVRPALVIAPARNVVFMSGADEFSISTRIKGSWFLEGPSLSDRRVLLLSSSIEFVSAVAMI